MNWQDELLPGNLIYFDHDQYREPINPIQIGIVSSWDENYIVMTGGFKCKRERTKPIPLTIDWKKKFGLSMDLPYSYVHTLQLALKKIHGEMRLCYGHVFKEGKVTSELPT